MIGSQLIVRCGWTGTFVPGVPLNVSLGCPVQAGVLEGGSEHEHRDPAHAHGQGA
jgi:hypothetical protein